MSDWNKLEEQREPSGTLKYKQVPNVTSSLLLTSGTYEVKFWDICDLEMFNKLKRGDAARLSLHD